MMMRFTGKNPSDTAAVSDGGICSVTRRGRRPSCARPDSLLGYLRMRRNLGLQDVSRATNVDPMVLWNLEQLHFNVRLSSCQSLAAFYDITLDEMINNDWSVLIRLDTRHCPVSEKEYIQSQEASCSRRISIGRRGELLVADLERQKLAAIGFDSAVDAGPGLIPSMGYDVMSFTAERQPLFIEVKTTSAAENVSFHMSANERAFMRDCYRNNIAYELHRIYDINSQPQRLIYTPEDLLQFKTIPCDYVITPERGESEYDYD